MSTSIERHIFEVFEGEYINNPQTWCKHCNTTLSEISGLHPICPFCEGPTHCLDIDCVEPCLECWAKQESDPIL